ncbi:FAD-binding oxidoreductase [Marinobacter sediminum]|uniref:NAD(P)/FAD-dependent oxidoreductase n=1 Tax=Marinobacter sediminum TaxID=256323 RepID=UPI002030580F|nr:FAD-binding oxidoreductase [Marinobacter sediminum]
MTSSNQQSVVVIGAGIIGVCAALELQKRGYAVTLVESKYPAAEASSGNCGLLAVGSVVPFSKPGTFKKVPGWLLNTKGPLSIRLGYLPKLMPWIIRFLMAAKPSRIQEIGEALATLTAQAGDAYQPWLEEAGISDIVKPYETLVVYETEAEYQDDLPNLEMERALGYDHEHLTGRQLQELEPSIAADFACAVKKKGWYYFSDPERLVRSLYDLFMRKGGAAITGKVRNLNTDGQRVRAVSVDGGEEVQADHIVIAAGAWSRKLAEELGDAVPVEALAGYSTTVTDAGIDVQHPVTYAAGGFVITPMEGGLRIGGTIEMGGLDSSPNFDRAKVIAEKAKRVFPSLKSIEGEEWMGYRSFMPDTLPVIDRASRFPNVYYAFGHGQIGITTGAITGRLVAQLVAGEETSIAMKPYSVSRF